MPTINPPDKKTEEKPEEKTEKEVTLGNITNKELVRLIWAHLGSPYGTPEEWLQNNQEIRTSE